MIVQKNYFRNNLSIFSLLDFNLKIFLVIPYLVIIDNYNSIYSIICFLVITSLLIGLKFNYIVDTEKSCFNKSISFFSIHFQNNNYKLKQPFQFKKSHLQGLGPKMGSIHNRHFIKIQLFNESPQQIIFIAHEKHIKELRLLCNSLQNIN